MNLTPVTEINPLAKSNINLNTFRFIPDDLQEHQTYYHQDYINRLNQRLFTRLRESGKILISSTHVDGNYVLHEATLKPHTLQNNTKAMTRLIVEIGQQVDEELRSRITFNAS